MSTVTKPLALDETLQDVAVKLGAIAFSTVTGQQGNPGKDAYESAQDGGFTGTEAEFNSEIAKMPTVIRPNLLDNWYFVGGGTSDAFPVNQKGTTTSSANGYTIPDRWKISTSGTVTVKSDCVNFSTSGSSYKRYMQVLPSGIVEVGKTYTISFFLKVNSISGTAYLRFNYLTNSVMPSALAALPSTAGTYLITLTYTVPEGYSGPYSIEILVSNNSTSQIDADIYAAKLELGDTQTMCHNEGTDANPVWVLNEIPIFSEELLKCQRCYQLFRTSSLRPTYPEDFRPVMRTTPTFGTISINGTTYYYAAAEYI